MVSRSASMAAWKLARFFFFFFFFFFKSVIRSSNRKAACRHYLQTLRSHVGVIYRFIGVEPQGKDAML